MPHWEIERDRQQDNPPRAAIGQPVQQDIVIVVGRSPVNLIVLSRIVERARMRAVSATPEAAGQLIARGEAAIVILDGGPDMRECDGVLGVILDQKLVSSGDRPFVIMLTMRNIDPQTLETQGVVDALVAKPVTPEKMQPLIESIRDRALRA